MPWLAVAATVGGSVISGAMGSRAAGKAADAQTQAAQAQIAEQRRQYDVTRADQAPFQASGVAGNQRLAYLLGLTPGQSASGAIPAGGAAGGGGGPVNVPTTYMPGQSGDPVWEELLGQFNQTHGARYGIPMNRPWGSDADAQQTYAELSEEYRRRKAAEQTGQAGQAGGADPSSDPAYGSLLRKFAASDLQADPVYQSGLQFGLDQGTGAINSRAIAGGGYDSGATIKALTRYANDYGSTKANESYNRYNTDNTNIYNKLAGISGTGQTATNQIQSAGQNATNQINQAQGAEGNARSAGIVGGANAWTNAINQGYGNYNNYQMSQALAKLRQPQTSGYGGSYATAPSSYYTANDPNNYMMGN